MKKAIVALIAILLLYSCWGPEQGGCTLYTYTIKNESGKNINIKANRIDFPNNPPVITNLPIGGKLTKTFKSCPPSGSYDFTDLFADKNTKIIDTITIIYEKSKFSSFKKDCTARNPLNFCDITSEVTFIFTAQDYEDAQDCNGNCD